MTLPWQHPTGETPTSVNILACGPTQATYHAGHLTYDPVLPPADETWLVNKAIRTCRGDVAFVMDDLVGEAHQSEQYRRDLAKFPGPILTSTVDQPVSQVLHDRYGDTYPLPLDLMVRYFGMRVLRARGVSEQSAQLIDRVGLDVAAYWHNSIPYMLAYAAFIGVANVFLYGADYTHPKSGADIREDDRANCEYWVGFLRALGVSVAVTADTTLLNKLQHKGKRWFYGFGARQPVIAASTLQDCEAMAEYIEKRATS